MFIFSIQPDNLAHDADEDSVTRSLEAYLLWLFRYIMFNNSHGAYVDRVLVPYAQEIAEAAVEEMPQYSWGSAVLAAQCNSYRMSDSATTLVVREDSNWSSDYRPLTV